MNSVRMAHINTQKFLSSPAANNLQNVFSAQQEIIDDYTQVQTDPIKHPRGKLCPVITAYCQNCFSSHLPHPLNLHGSLVYELSKESCPQFN